MSTLDSLINSKTNKMAHFFVVLHKIFLTVLLYDSSYFVRTPRTTLIYISLT